MFASERAFLTDWTSFMLVLEVHRDSQGIKILMTSESDKVLLAFHRISVAARFELLLALPCFDTTPIVVNLITRRPNPILNFLISLGVVSKDAYCNAMFNFFFRKFKNG